MYVKSLNIFIVINSLVVGLTLLKDGVCKLWDYSYPIIFVSELASTTFLLLSFYYGTSQKKDILQNNSLVRTIPTEIYPCEFKIKIISAVFVKSFTHYILINYYIDSSIPSSNYLVYFVVRSFVFELIFDFFHYGFHRLMHENKTLYQLLHKIHHKFENPTAETTFYIHPGDLILAYSIPIVISCMIINPSTFEFQLISMYLTYQEIGGHLGKQMYPTSSFPQFIWLPRLLGIELYTEDHDLHHSKFKWNYSKRFVIWDKVFGTFKSNVNVLSSNE
jgi:sterol desaturase/sphingolipid hydroxylase (fatty acid hydroxylase superfamily)